MVEFVKRVTKGRMASKKVRKKDVSNTFSKDRLDKFKDIVENLDTVSREILLVEGEQNCPYLFYVLITRVHLQCANEGKANILPRIISLVSWEDIQYIQNSYFGGDEYR